MFQCLVFKKVTETSLCRIIEEREGGGHVPLRDKIFTESSLE